MFVDDIKVMQSKYPAGSKVVIEYMKRGMIKDRAYGLIMKWDEQLFQFSVLDRKDIPPVVWVLGQMIIGRKENNESS